MNAIILAAGMGSRLKELTKDTPKPLVTINGKNFIENQISYLLEANIKDITIVTGYKAEQFNYLINKYGVKIIYNENYNKYNNFYSLYKVREIFGDSYLIDADNYLLKNLFRNDLDKSYYYSINRDNCLNEYFIYSDSDEKIIDIEVNKGCGDIIAGISYWTKEEAKKILKLMENYYNSGNFINMYWDDIVRLNINEFNVYEYKLDEYDIFEVDTINDYKILNNILKRN